MSIDKVAKELLSTMKSADASGTKPYDTPATVLRVEGDTAWVHIPGGVDETPVALTVNAKAGDTVQVRVSGGRAFIIGNVTAPPTDDTKAEEANTMAKTANTKANKASEDVAELAKKIGGNDNQYFWHVESGTDTGSHITETPKDSFISNPQGNNILIRSNGIAIRDAMDEVAIFGADGAQIGQEVNGQSRSIITEAGMQVLRRDDLGTDTQIVNLGYGPGVMIDMTIKDGPYISLGVRKPNSTIGNLSIAEGRMTEASGYASHAEGSYTIASIGYSHAEGSGTKAIGQASHAEGSGTTASGYPSHAEGIDTIASNEASHAEGGETEASGRYSHAEGNHTEASGISSHAEGLYSIASGEMAHAEGTGTEAIGDFSHAQNVCTVATRCAQTAIGRFNIRDTQGADKSAKGKFVFMIGNGDTDNSRSNALDVDWDGNIRMALDTTASTGTIDGDLYKAITDLGWEGDVINA